MVWKQVGHKPPQQAPEAASSSPLHRQLQAPISSRPLGRGRLLPESASEGPSRPESSHLTVTARAMGSAEEATVIVKIEQDYVVESF